MKLLTIAFILITSLGTYSQCKDTSAQRAEFVKLPSVDKVQLWRTHLKHELDTRKLDGFQRDLILASLELLTDDVYDRKLDLKFFAKFRKELRANFSQKEGSEIFEQLPDYKVTGDSLIRDCNCSTWWTFCDSGTCFASSYCTHIINCGPFWIMECDGKCQFG